MLGIRTFFLKAITYLQTSLPLSNQLLRHLTCLNPLKRKHTNTVAAIQHVFKKLLPHDDVSLIHDEWAFYQSDVDIPVYDPKTTRLDHFWREVIQLTDNRGQMRYRNLAPLVKAALILDKGNADSERSLSVNTSVVTKARVRLHEHTIVGLRSVKEAVRFYDPEHLRPEKIPITSELRSALRSAHASYTARREAEKEDEERKKLASEQARKQKETLQKEVKAAEEAKKDLATKEEDLRKEAKKAQEELDTANKLMSDGSARLQATLSGPGDKTEMNVASSMIDTGVKKRDEAKKKQESLRAELDAISTKRQNLLDQIIHSVNVDYPSSKRKGSSKDKPGKKIKYKWLNMTNGLWW